MSDLLAYFNAQAEKDSAYHQYCYAGQLLENKTVKCRLAEIKSQNEPIASIIGKTKTTKKQLISVAEYVVLGRLPKGGE